jgi:ubiquinone/menaquinone biosynthesis C-methylase UbiE
MPATGAPAGDLPLFDRLSWTDPLSGRPLLPRIEARTPAGVPLCGALQIADTDTGYPIVDAVARMTPALAVRHAPWLQQLGLRPAGAAAPSTLQDESTVESFGFQWSWNSAMRTAADLDWRVAARFGVDPSAFRGRLVIDAGAGAGDQSRWLVEHGASVVSVDLSAAIDVVAAKLRLSAEWVGVQGDLAALPFAEAQFDFVYCEGVIQHTRDSARTVRQLTRALKPGGEMLATHYDRPQRLVGRVRHAYQEALRARLSRWDRYRLLLLTGNLAALAHLPIVGRLVGKTGTAIRYALMPDFKTTWTNTYDFYGPHAFQRYVDADEFWRYFEQAGGVEGVHRSGTVVRARRAAAPAALPGETAPREPA